MARHVSAALAGASVPLKKRYGLRRALAEDLSPNDTPGWRAETKRRLAEVLTDPALDKFARERVNA